MAKRSKANPGDWSLPNAELARIWGVHPETVGVWRRKAKAPRPRWTLHAGGWMREVPEYQAAVAAEEARAAKA